MEIAISNPEEISQILNVIHDKWFNLSSIQNSKVPGTLIIRVASTQINLKKIDGHAGQLEIRGVKKIEIFDSERIETYDINLIEYDDIQKRIRISCGIPLEVAIFVDSLNLAYTSFP